MNRKAITASVALDNKLPKYLCGNLRLPCGRRNKNKGCRCSACGYAIQTRDMPLRLKEVLLAYSKS